MFIFAALRKEDVYIHRTHTHTQNFTYILCKESVLFWMRLNAINHLTALIIIMYIYNVLQSLNVIYNFIFIRNYYILHFHE